MKFLLFVLSVENNYLVYFLITTMFLNFLSIDTFNFISLNFFFDIISSISSLSTTSIMDFFLNFINLNSNTLDYNFSELYNTSLINSISVNTDILNLFDDKFFISNNCLNELNIKTHLNISEYFLSTQITTIYSDVNIGFCSHTFLNTKSIIVYALFLILVFFSSHFLFFESNLLQNKTSTLKNNSFFFLIIFFTKNDLFFSKLNIKNKIIFLTLSFFYVVYTIYSCIIKSFFLQY